MDSETFAIERRVKTLEQDIGLMAANGLDALRLQRALSMVSFNCNPVTVDPPSPRNGTIWYRSDLNAFRLRINGTTYSLLATPAVRTISLPFTGADNARTGARVVTAYDAHGTFTQYGPHVDNADADASFKQLRWAGIKVPGDFSSAMTLKFLFSSSVASNNAVFGAGARETLTGATGHTTSLNEGGAGLLTLACPGTADTIATGSIAFDVAPTAGRSLMVGIDINTNHANDSNTGTKTLWDVWLEYVPTL